MTTFWIWLKETVYVLLTRKRVRQGVVGGYRSCLNNEDPVLQNTAVFKKKNGAEVLWSYWVLNHLGYWVTWVLDHLRYGVTWGGLTSTRSSVLAKLGLITLRFLGRGSGQEQWPNLTSDYAMLQMKTSELVGEADIKETVFTPGNVVWRYLQYGSHQPCAIMSRK